MTEISGRHIHFTLTASAREIFESIIISRFSVRDESDEVLRTEAGLALLAPGASRCKLSLSSAEVLLPTRSSAKRAIAPGGAPERAVVTATWHPPSRIDEARIPVRAAENANVFFGLGAILVPDGLRIPVVTATRDNVRHYGLSLIGDGETAEILSDQFALVLAKYRYAPNYRRDFLLEESGGGGYFVERHNFPHLHVPLRPDCGGFIIVGKRFGANRFEFTGFRIPYGFALYTPANTIHGDGTIVGEYAISVATATADADTVLFYNEATRAMARDLFAEV